MKKNTVVNRLLNNSYFLNSLVKGIHIILGIFITAFLNRALGASLKGQYAYYYNAISLLTIIGGFGIYQLYPFYRRKEGADIKNDFACVTMMLAGLYIVASFLLCLFYWQTFSKGNFFIYILLSMNTIVKIVDTQFLMFASIDDFIKSKKNGIAISVYRFIIFFVIFLFYKKNIIAVLLGDLACETIGVFLYSRILNIQFNKLSFPIKEFWGILKKGIIPMLFQLMLQLNYNIDIIYMKLFSTVSFRDIGLYSVGVQLAAYIWTVPDVFKEVLYSKTAKKDSIDDIIWCIRFSILFELIFLIIIFIQGGELIFLLYGEEFSSAITVTKIIFVGVISMTLFKILTPLYNAKGEFKANLIILFISVLINIVLNVILIPRYGMIGAAVASVFGYSVCGIVYFSRFCKDFKVSANRLLLFSKKEFLSFFESKH